MSPCLEQKHELKLNCLFNIKNTCNWKGPDDLVWCARTDVAELLFLAFLTSVLWGLKSAIDKSQKRRRGYRNVWPSWITLRQWVRWSGSRWGELPPERVCSRRQGTRDLGAHMSDPSSLQGPNQAGKHATRMWPGDKSCVHSEGPRCCSHDKKALDPETQNSAHWRAYLLRQRQSFDRHISYWLIPH